ncbi:MAG: DUF5131 family protein [Pirellulales bacterium]
MGENTKIEWAHHTFNQWRGCTKVAPGCANCYAESLSKRNPSTLGIWGPDGTRVMAAESAWREPVKWNKAAEAAGERHRVFCASLADVFEDWRGPVRSHNGDDICVCHGCGEHVLFIENCKCGAERLPRKLTLNDLRRDLFALIDATPHLDWLVLTKRPENILRMWPAVTIGSQEQADDRNERGELYRRNVWLLTSIATQADADKNLPAMRRCVDLVPVLGISAEPLIEPVDFRLAKSISGESDSHFKWIIVGGESGHHARPFNVAWARSIIKQCRDAGVPCFVKQLGSAAMEFSIHDLPRGMTRFVHSKGGDWNEWPADLRVREFPAVTRVSSNA